MMKKLIFLVTLTIIFWGLPLAQAKAQDTVLLHYLSIAAQNNPGLKASFNSYLAALEKIPQVKALPDPQLLFGAFIMPVQTRTGPQQFKISVTQMFPWVGYLGAKKDVATLRAKAAYEIFLQKKAELFYQVRTTYYELYFLDKSIKITQENLQLLQTLKQLANVQIQANKASAIDGLRIELDLGDMENDLARLKDLYNAKKEQFTNLLNTNQLDGIILPDTLWTDTLPMNYAQIIDSLASNHTLLSLEQLSLSLDKQSDVARKQGMPVVIAGVDYTFIGAADQNQSLANDALMFRIGISIPIYRKKYSAMVKEARLMAQATREQQQDKLNSLQSLFEKVYADLMDAQRRMELYKRQKSIAWRSIKILEDQYRSQSRNFEEILRMQRRYLGYSLQLERARADYQAALAFIFLLIGKE
jgi:outer membrane protein TolC